MLDSISEVRVHIVYALNDLPNVKRSSLSLVLNLPCQFFQKRNQRVIIEISDFPCFLLTPNFPQKPLKALDLKQTLQDRIDVACTLFVHYSHDPFVRR